MSGWASVSQVRLSVALAALLAAALASPALASVAVGTPAATATVSDCDSGLVYDDGTYESGLSFPAGTRRGRAMTLFVPDGRQRLEKVCLCWERSGGSENPLEYDLGVWAADGPNGSPGTLLGELTGRRSDFVPQSFPGSQSPRFTSHDLSVLGLVIDAPVYLGATWDTIQGPSYSLCIDSGPDTARRPGFAQREDADGWSPLFDLGASLPSSVYRALGIRAGLEDAGPATDCDPSTETLCLDGNRFAVTVNWQTSATSGIGRARTISGVDFSGLFWFFDPGNLELLVKVLDGCAINGHYWVFWAGTTNVGFTLRVKDVERDLERVYVNPLGIAARPTQDTGAFRCDQP